MVFSYEALSSLFYFPLCLHLSLNPKCLVYLFKQKEKKWKKIIQCPRPFYRALCVLWYTPCFLFSLSMCHRYFVFWGEYVFVTPWLVLHVASRGRSGCGRDNLFPRPHYLLAGNSADNFTKDIFWRVKQDKKVDIWMSMILSWLSLSYLPLLYKTNASSPCNELIGLQ